MDVQALTAPLSDEAGARAGPDLSYDDARVAIEAPFQLDADGETVEERQWREAIRGITAQAAQTRDLWLAVYLARAGAKIGDLQMVADGTALLAGLLEDLWDDVHPTLEEADFVGRKTPCDSLTKLRDFLNPLRRTTLFEHRLGKFSGEDLERFAAEGDANDRYGVFRAALGSSDPEAVKDAFGGAVSMLEAIRSAIQRVDAVLVAHAGADTGTNFATTYEVIDALRRAAAPYVGQEAAAAAKPAASGGGAVAGVGGPAVSGSITSREDVIRAIDAVVDYYKVREPASPVPTLLKRARHWVRMDFLELIDEMLPDSATAARQLLVSKLDAPPDDSGW